MRFLQLILVINSIYLTKFEFVISKVRRKSMQSKPNPKRIEKLFMHLFKHYVHLVFIQSKKKHKTLFNIIFRVCICQTPFIRKICRKENEKLFQHQICLKIINVVIIRVKTASCLVPHYNCFKWHEWIESVFAFSAQCGTQKTWWAQVIL